MKDEDPEEADESPEDELKEQFRARYRISTAAWRAQRKREENDLRFLVPENQWSDKARREREGGSAGSIPVPARPCLSVSLIDQPLQQIKNQQRNSKLGIQIHPQSENAPDETAEVIQGLYRSIERDSPADQARGWAFDRAATCGTGAYRILTDYDETADSPEAEWDQVIRIERILDQASVTWDPAATMSDMSDAEYVHVAAWLPIARFKALYPSATVPTSEDLSGEDGIHDPTWVRFDDEGKPAGVKLVEYWYKVHDWEEVKHPEKDAAPRMKDVVTVRCAKFTGGEQLLEDYPWNGHLLPIVFVYARELQPFDGSRRWIGMVSNIKDAQRTFNYALSEAVQAVALEPKAPYIGYLGQFEGQEASWQQANIRNFAYLQVKPVIDGAGGQVLPLPQRTQIDGSKMQVSMALSEQARGWVQTGTAMFDPSLGRANGSERSGKAIQSLQQQGDEATSDFLAVLADVSLRQEARIVLDLLPAIYDRQGRIAHILDDKDKVQTVMLNAPYYEDPQSGALVPMDGRGQPYPPGTKFYDLSKGRYGVAVSVGKSYQTRMADAADHLGQIISSEPQLLPIIGPYWARNQDFPYAKDLADDLLKWRDSQMPFLRDQQQGAPDPQQLQQQNQAMQQQMQGMQQQMQQMQQAMQTEQAKQQAQIQTAQIKADSALQTTQVRAETDKQIAALRAQVEAMKMGAQHGQDMVQAQHDAAHDVAMAQIQTGQDVAKDQAKQATAAALAPLSLNPLRGSEGQPLEPSSGAV